MKGRPSATLAKVQINQNIEVMSGGGRGVCNTHRHHHHRHRHHYDDDDHDGYPAYSHPPYSHQVGI